MTHLMYDHIVDILFRYLYQLDIEGNECIFAAPPNWMPYGERQFGGKGYRGGQPLGKGHSDDHEKCLGLVPDTYPQPVAGHARGICHRHSHRETVWLTPLSLSLLVGFP